MLCAVMTVVVIYLLRFYYHYAYDRCYKKYRALKETLLKLRVQSFDHIV